MLPTHNAINEGIKLIKKKLVTKFSPDEIRRILDLEYVGNGHVNFVDPLQKPSLFFIPGLTAKPWWDVAEVPRVQQFVSYIEQNWQLIRDELNKFSIKEHTLNYQHLSIENEHTKSWKVIFFIKNNQYVDENFARCPVLSRLVKQSADHELIKIEMFLSNFLPGTHLPAHYGTRNFVLTLHLPIIIPPEGCALKVGDETRAWQEGKVCIFDDSFLHEAWNHSAQNRVVFILETYNPDLTDIEIDALQYIYKDIVQVMGEAVFTN